MIGCACAVCRSTDPRDQRLRTSALLRSGGQNWIIDTGPDFRQQMLRARVDEIAGVILTHEHNDHIAGLDDLRPFCFRQEMDIPVYCLPRVAADIRRRYAYVFGSYPGVPRIDIRTIEFGDRLACGDEEVEFLRVDHGRLPIVGLRTERLAYLTDVKELPARTQVRCKGLDSIVLSALNQRGTHSHLSLPEAVDYLRRLAPGRAWLTHLSHRMGLAAELDGLTPDTVRVGYDGLTVAC